MSAHDLADLYEALNRTDRAVPPALPAQLFREQAARRPDGLAISTPATTYAELDELSDSVAAAVLGLPWRPIVPLDLDPGLELYAAMLGVAKAGAAFGMGAKGTGLDAGWVGAAIRAHRPTPAVPPQAAQGGLAYAITTSGSTGEPKTVLVAHASLVNLALWAGSHLGIGLGSRVAQLYPPHRDTILQEVFGTLLAGGTLHPCPVPARISARRLIGWLEQEAITHLDTFPEHWAKIMPHKPQLPALQVLVLGGSPLGRDLVPDIPARMFNAYGPTEATVTATTHEVSRESPGDTVPIGTPIWNTTCHLLDSRRRLCPPGRPGELYLGGTAVAVGYHDDPKRTAQAFLGFGAGARLYRTGDIAVLREDGLGLDFLHRAAP